MLFLIPVAAKDEYQRTKEYLEQYQEAKRLHETFPDKTSEEDLRTLTNIEKAFSTFLDEEMKQIMVYRYIKGNVNKVTVRHFAARGMSERTVERKLEAGILVIANALLYCGQFDKK
ncbi:hypothetical protein ACHHV8_33590 [Paenibacillus sp. TAB 01]|uniref:hypothetical protein n=1 Tax=Paenibacillus sp. TAB 01 TaxID=3368988 RepID=UPI003750FA54